MIDKRKEQMMNLVDDTSAPATINRTKASVKRLVDELKSKGEDFEFYPTTDEQIDAVTSDLRDILKTYSFKTGRPVSILDVGAGDGNVLMKLKESLDEGVLMRSQSVSMFAIEKSFVHIMSYRGKGINLVGRDFYESNLLTKKADVLFTNPPYSRFSSWVSKTIQQADFSIMYAVIPSRWRDDRSIAEAIASRKVTNVEVIATSDFSDGLRQARAKVDVVRFSFEDFNDIDPIQTRRFERTGYKPQIGCRSTDAFQQFIENEIGITNTCNSTYKDFSEAQEKARVKREMESADSVTYGLVKHRGVLHALLDDYDRAINRIITQYKKIGELDSSLLSELGVESKEVLASLRGKLVGMRNVYWGLLFDELEVLSSRLIDSKKIDFLNTLKSNALDFTYDNAIYVISYATEIANEMIDESFIEVFRDLTSPSSISMYYKSNEHVLSDRWRYNTPEALSKSKFTLDYRFVYSSYVCFEHDYSLGRASLSTSSRSFISDVKVIFHLLGYSRIEQNLTLDEIESGQDELVISGSTPSGEIVKLLAVRFYKNGNRHIRFDSDFMLRFNVTASRLLGWVRTKDEFAREVGIEVGNSDWEALGVIHVKPENVPLLGCVNS